MAFAKRQITDEDSLYDYAVGALGRRMRTVAELKRLLRGRVPRDEIGNTLVELVVLRLKQHKYLNDSQYAAAYSALRRDNEKFGPRRVVTDLKVKGVHASVIEKAIDEAYSGADEMEMARAFLRRKRTKPPSNDREAAKIFRALMRAGYNTRVAMTILKKWKVEDEVLTALQEEASEE